MSVKKKTKNPFDSMDLPWESLDEYKHPEQILEALEEALREYPAHAGFSKQKIRKSSK